MKKLNRKQRDTIALNIREAMEKTFPGKGRGKRLAAMLGVAPSTVSQWASGKTVPSLSHLYAMSRVFGIPLHRLCDLPADRNVGIQNLAFDITRRIVACKSEKGGSVNSRPADAGEREAINLIGKVLRSIIHGSPENR